MLYTSLFGSFLNSRSMSSRFFISLFCFKVLLFLLKLQSQLLTLQGDAPLGDVEVFLVQLEAEEVPMLLDAGDGGGAAADKRVENEVIVV